MVLNLSKSEAKSLFLHSQSLYQESEFRGKQDTLKIIEQLNYIQIDSISVIERAHHHVLWNRISNYSPLFVDQLMAEDRQIFEYWAHAAAYLPMKNYRYYLPKMNQIQERSNWVRKHYQELKHLIPSILHEVKKNGPMTAKDFISQKKQKGGWWNWKPAKVVLELLYWKGELMVSHRKNFQKVYDLSERILPPSLNLSYPTTKEVGDYHTLNAIKALGIANVKEISETLLPRSQQAVKQSIHELIEEDKIIACKIQGLNGLYYVLKPLKTINLHHTDTCYLLSPFDNLVIQRQRLKDFFDFDYKIECYVPKEKRVYGYFSLPILWHKKIVGLIDLKADRKQKSLAIQHIFLIEKEHIGSQFIKAFSHTLNQMSEFNHCQSIIVDSQFPEDLLKSLQKFCDIVRG